MADPALARRYPLVRWPRVLRPASGGFVMRPGVRIRFDPPLRAQAAALAAHLEAVTGHAPALGPNERRPDSGGAAAERAGGGSETAPEHHVGDITLALRPDAPAGAEA